MEKPDYGNWVPLKILSLSLLASVFSYLVTLFLDVRLFVGVFRIASILFLGFFIYLVYVYWLLEKDDKTMQRLFWDLLIDRLKWDGSGKALDIGTGSGPVARLLARRHPEALVKGIDYWGGALDILKAEMYEKRGDRGRIRQGRFREGQRRGSAVQRR